MKASKDHDPVVKLNHFEWAKDKILMGAERKSAYITPEVYLVISCFLLIGFSNEFMKIEQDKNCIS